MNYAQEFQQMIQYLTENKIEFKVILDGPFYNKKYSTVMIKIYQPSDSAIDLDHISIVIAIKLTDPEKKPKVAFIIKGAAQVFLDNLVEQFDNLKLSLPNKIQHLQTQFDSFLLTQFQYFDRYQTTDENNVTITRYILKEITTKEQKEKEKIEEKERQKEEQLQRQREKQEYEKQQWDKQEQLKELALQAKKQKQLDEQSEESSENIFTEAVYGNNKQYVNQNEKENSKSEQKKDNKDDDLEIIITKSNSKTKYYFYSEQDFVTVKQLEEEKQRVIRENRQLQDMKNKQQNKQEQQQDQPVKSKIIKMLTDEQNVIFRNLMKKLGQNNFTQQIFIIMKQYFNSVKLLSEGNNSTILFINYPCKYLNQVNFKSENLQHLNLFIKDDQNNIPLLISISKTNYKNSFIRIDPNNNFLNKIDEFIKQHQYEAALFKQNLLDQQLLSRCSKLLSQMLIKYSQSKIEQDGQEQQSQQINDQQSDVKIIFPKNYKKQQINKKENIEITIQQEEYTEIIQKLPKIFHNVPLLQTKCYMADFLNNMIPSVIQDLFDISQKQIFDERVQAYYLQQEKELQKEEQSKKGKQQQVESSSSSESSDQSEELEESDESTVSSSEDSNSSAFTNVNTIKDTWLAHSSNQQSRVINLKLFGLSFQNILVAQFVQPTISVMCSKCNKMLLQQIVLESTNQKVDGIQCQSDILSGTTQCSFCQAQMTLTCQSLLFNPSTNGQALLVTQMKNCLALNLGFVESSHILMQCTNCSTIGYYTSLRLQSDGKYSCRCPMCFQRLIIGFNQSIFVLPNGEPVQIPGAEKRQIIEDAKAKANQQNAFTSNIIANSPHGVCKHYKHSFRWFKFPCGNIFPCDVCHEEHCSCGKNQASIQICGYCNRQSSVQDVCPFCHANLTKKHTNSWQGGMGCRNKALMNKKDDKKYKGFWKTRSNKDRKKTEQRFRGNKKVKKPVEDKQ